MADVVAQLRRTYRGEEEWFPLLEEFGHRTLRRKFMACGITPTVAGQLVWFLDEQLHLERSLNQASRARYRQILRKLDIDEVSRATPRQFKWARSAA